MNCGYELGDSSAKGEGVFATRFFKIGEFEFVLHAGLTNKVNHSFYLNCGIEVNKCEAHDSVSIKDLTHGQEITYDYAIGNYTVDYFPLEC